MCEEIFYDTTSACGFVTVSLKVSLKLVLVILFNVAKGQLSGDDTPIIGNWIDQSLPKCKNALHTRWLRVQIH